MISYRKYLLATIPFLILFACQEENFNQNDQVLTDDDMTIATKLADDFFEEERGRFGKVNYFVTVLKYEDGQMYFLSSDDFKKGYQLLEETSITAYAKPGDFIFWFGGKGISDLEDIDFDAEARSYLNDSPFQVKIGRFWALQIPDVYNEEVNSLKYDVVYKSRDNADVTVRLDPKVQVTQ